MGVELDLAIANALTKVQADSNQLSTDLTAIQDLAFGCAIPNIPPSIIATANKVVNEGDIVNIAATVTDSDGTYTTVWVQKSGPTVVFTEDGLNGMSFTAPEVTVNQILVFTITATDNAGASVSADVTVTVNDVPVIIPAPTLFEGFGLSALGGTAAYDVSTLSDSGAGSLRDALSASSRHIKFSVSGTINLQSEILIKTSHLFVDGYSSAGGITIAGNGLIIEGNTSDNIGAKNIIIQGLRIQNTAGDGLRAWRNAHTIVFDHCSVLNSGDGNIDITEGAHDITISWCLMTSSASGSTLQSYEAYNITHHHNFYFGGHRRNPLVDNTARFYSNRPGNFPPLDPWAHIEYNVLWNYGWGMKIDADIVSANVINNLFTDGDINANSSFLVNKSIQGFLSGNAATMDIRTSSQWESLANITSANSNTYGLKHSAPAISGVDRLTEWSRVVSEAGSGQPDNAEEAAARVWRAMPDSTIFSLSWNDG